MSWNCCRTCLSGQNLNPIFPAPETAEKYKNAILYTTGITVNLCDGMSQQMCTTCILFINESLKFRRKCEETNKILQETIKNKQSCLKYELENLKTEISKFVTIDINILEDNTEFDQHFNDYDDNISLSTLHYLNNYDTSEEKDIQLKIDLNNIETPAETKTKPKIRVSNKTKKDRKKENNIEINCKIKTKRNNSEERKNKNVGREKIECEYCHKILAKLSLRNHYKIHTGFGIVCEHCGKKFITRRLLLMHCRAKHGYEKVDKCSYCDYRASNAEQVKIHERLHTGERPFTCVECGAGFHRNSSYLQHVAIHLPEKTVQCSLCPARFKSVTLMRIHKSRHKPPAYRYKCPECGGTFARRRNVSRHLQRAHRTNNGDGIVREHIH